MEEFKVFESEVGKKLKKNIASQQRSIAYDIVFSMA
jgi:hypothetical protein